MKDTGKILVIDDETGIRQGCVRVLQPQGFTVETAESYQAGLKKIQSGEYDLVLLDVMLPDGKGIDLLGPIRSRDPETVAIIITGYATVELAVDTIKKGAYNFISKPFTADLLLMTVHQGLEKRRLSLEARRLQSLEHETAELARARDEAERLNEFKSSFMLTAAHELRSPVSGAQSLVRTLLRGLAGELNPQQAELLGRVEVRLDFLLELINDLLTLAASKSIEPEKPLDTVRLLPVVEHIVDLFSDEAGNKPVSLKLTAPDPSIQVRADEKELETILRNLVSNAVKYTPAGGNAQVEVVREGEFARLRVCDTGIGISPEELPHIGEEFFRARNAHQEGIRGTGLGMSIVKQLVERFGGRLEIESELGQGTTFTVLLKAV